MFVSVSLGQGLRSNSVFNLDFNLTPESTTPPVPILRFIDRQNPDGSYTYGYESGDGTYKIETRYATGEVKGKYGYIDSNGELREVEYGATPERGFEPRAEGLILPPPTLDSDSAGVEVQVAAPVAPVAPVAAAKPVEFSNFSPRNGATRVVVRKKDRRAQLPIRGKPSLRRPAAVPVAAPARPLPRPSFVPQQPAGLPVVPSHRFDGHPARNINLQTGSYSISYSG